MLTKQGDTPVFTALRVVDNQYPLYGVMTNHTQRCRSKLFLANAKPTVLINENIQNQLQITGW